MKCIRAEHLGTGGTLAAQTQIGQLDILSNENLIEMQRLVKSQYRSPRMGRMSKELLQGFGTQYGGSLSVNRCNVKHQIFLWT
jgi:hypothetical protein